MQQSNLLENAVNPQHWLCECSHIECLGRLRVTGLTSLMPVNHSVKIWITGFETVLRWCLRTLWMIWYTHTHTYTQVQPSGGHTVAVCVCKISRPCDSNGCVSWVFRFVTVLSCCAKPLCGDNGRRGAEWGDKFRMRGSDEAFRRPPVGPQSCTASDGCIYCRPTSTASLITRIDKLALPHLLTTHTKRDRRHLNGSCGMTHMPPPSFLASLFLFLTSNHLLSRSEYSASSSSLLQMLFLFQ